MGVSIPEVIVVVVPWFVKRAPRNSAKHHAGRSMERSMFAAQYAGSQQEPGERQEDEMLHACPYWPLPSRPTRPPAWRTRRHEGARFAAHPLSRDLSKKGRIGIYQLNPRNSTIDGGQLKNVLPLEQANEIHSMWNFAIIVIFPDKVDPRHIKSVKEFVKEFVEQILVVCGAFQYTPTTERYHGEDVSKMSHCNS